MSTFNLTTTLLQPVNYRFGLRSLLCIMTLLALAQSGTAQSGVLIGLYASHFDENDAEIAKPATEFRDLWVSWDGKEVEIVDVPALMVPRANGWWRMGATKTCMAACRGAYTEAENLWMQPGTAAPPAKAAAGCGRFEKRISAKAQGYQLTSQGYEMLNFISPEWISWTRFSHDHEPCQYRGFQWEYKYQVGTLNGFVTLATAEEKAVAFSDAVGSDQKAALQTAIDASVVANAESREGVNCDDQPEADESQWTINRKAGAWQARTYLDSPICPLGGWVDAVLPAKLVGSDTLPIEWTELEKQVPGLIDAVSSPGKDLLVAQVPSELRVFALAEGKLGRLLKTIPLDEKQYSIVMIEWATGRNVRRWTEELIAFKTQLAMRSK